MDRRCQQSWFCLLGLILLFCFTSSDALTSIEIPLHSGHLLPLSHKPHTIFISDPAIADIQINSPKMLYVSSKKIGETDLYVLDHQQQAMLKARIYVVRDLAQIRQAIKKIAPQATVKVEAVKHTIIITGTMKNPEKARQIIELINHTVDPDAKVLNYLKLEHAKQIYLKVKVVELSRELSQALGLADWQLSYQASGVLVSAINGTHLANALRLGESSNPFDINGLINAMNKEHLLKILAEPNLTALSGEKASFLAGGEFPILVPQPDGNSNTIEFKKFGVALDFLPTLAGEKTINLQVSTDVSALSHMQSVKMRNNYIPSLETRRATTTVELESGQSFAIAGLLQNDIRLAVNKFPGLSDLPIIGELFQSRDYMNKQTELVIIVTPYLVKPIKGAFSLPTQGMSEASKEKPSVPDKLTLLLEN